jgi:hypothetical protein
MIQFRGICAGCHNALRVVCMPTTPLRRRAFSDSRQQGPRSRLPDDHAEDGPHHEAAGRIPKTGLRRRRNPGTSANPTRWKGDLSGS